MVSAGTRVATVMNSVHVIAKAMAKNSRGHQLVVALNGCFPESIDSIRSDFDSLIPQEDIKLWYPSGDDTTPGRHAADELIREAFNPASAQVLELSFFELVDGHARKLYKVGQLLLAEAHVLPALTHGRAEFLQ